MKIIQVAPRYYPSLGGVEQLVKQYSEKLVNTYGHEVTVLTSDVDSDQTKWANGVRVKRDWSIPFMRQGPYMPVTPLLPWQLLTDKSDLWHLHANKRFTTDVSVLLQLLKKTPFVYTPHAGKYGTTKFGRFHNSTVGRMFQAADIVITDTIYEKNLLEKNGFKAKRFEVIPPGVDVGLFQKAHGNVLAHYSLTGKKVILYVGRLTKHKGLDVLLRAVAELRKKDPDIYLMVVGPDAGEQKYYVKLASELGISRATVFTGALDREDLRSAFKEASVFCLPSRNEAFGMVIIEAFAAGTPVVAANNSAIPEVVKDNETGLLYETENSTELADKISKLLEDKNLQQKLINNAALEVANTYNWDVIVARVNKLYLEIIK